ncbi:MAG: M48 family metalloprotease [Bdellovibrionales bacterium]
MRLHLWRAFLLLSVVVLVVVTLGQKMGHRDGLILSGAMALSIIALFLWYGDWRLLPMLKVQELEGQDPWEIRTILKTLSDRARVPMPRVFLIPNEAPQALALGRTLSTSKIFLTSGLLQQLDTEELKAVLAYNLMCIKNRSTLAFTIASALSEAILSISGTLDWSLTWFFGSSKSKRGPHFRPFTWLFSPFTAALVRIAVGRDPYLRADQDAARLMNNNKILAQVLWKLQSYALTQPFPATPAASHFFIVNPLTTNGLSRYFHAQPEVRDRIKNLVGHYPI